MTCSREHGRQMVEQYRARPFVEPELWAGKIARALAERPGLSPVELAEETGLTPEEVERGAFTGVK
ncbi:winged helix-turn-helix domain-containing protein [Kitasatospora griseola]|uniref:winged helix-turn-helix domain-containing protein n=1 Tax=Kitasatospora griseola TaxID=2064 RepID=UPI00343AD85E